MEYAMLKAFRIVDKANDYIYQKSLLRLTGFLWGLVEIRSLNRKPIKPFTEAL